MDRTQHCPGPVGVVVAGTAGLVVQVALAELEGGEHVFGVTPGVAAHQHAALNLAQRQ